MHIAHETAGAARTRSSLRPLFLRRDDEMQNSGRTPPRDHEVMPGRHCEFGPALFARNDGRWSSPGRARMLFQPQLIISLRRDFIASCAVRGRAAAVAGDDA